ncbi:UrcA family protein [Sphingomonas psychrotolerans]|uniref:UrcA family protein n=1 Tax=Sphingomonas psychrotolerans TaxID=1327635 RepID=A0ABU3MYX5_9SPHN|nr:UrcA family protein [Sphingomonas psychrotolerans]MDT8757504.1 UrcA family protein [Sphingomonas psychrotolerans]
MLNSLTFLALLAASAPQAVPAGAPATRHVRTADLDLSRPSGRAELDRRLARAVERVCPTRQIGESTRSLAGLRCRAETQERIAAQRSRVLAQATASTQLSSSDR